MTATPPAGSPSKETIIAHKILESQSRRVDEARVVLDVRVAQGAQIRESGSADALLEFDADVVRLRGALEALRSREDVLRRHHREAIERDGATAADDLRLRFQAVLAESNADRDRLVSAIATLVTLLERSRARDQEASAIRAELLHLGREAEVDRLPWPDSTASGRIVDLVRLPAIAPGAPQWPAA